MTDDAGRYLSLAARLALRAWGDVEPNPMVGAVIVKDGRIIGLGHHRRYGGLHAEREALADCRRRGEDPRGSTVYVTLEPCCHHGKQPPCTDALIEAGVAAVVAARRDPGRESGGGAAVLERAGIACRFSDASPLATAISDPFIKGTERALPWVLAKWAQTLDGRLVTRPDEPRWISGEAARRRVHRVRARVDAVLTGIGTALADDPRLTARGVRRHRDAMRVVLDSELQLPANSALVRTAGEASLVVFCRGDVATTERASSLVAHGVQVVAAPSGASGLDIEAVLRELRSRYQVTTVMLESGPRLLIAAFAADLIDLALVHVGGGANEPVLARRSAALAAPALADPARFACCRERRRGEDLEQIFGRVSASRTSAMAGPCP